MLASTEQETGHPGQVIVTGDITFTTREGNAIDVNVIRRLGEHQATGAAALHGMTLEEARTDPSAQWER